MATTTAAEDLADDLGDGEPFTPSAFLDLPPTPPRTEDEDLASSSDDTVLPFISRMLMEDDEGADDDICDHPAALLQAEEQRFAQGMDEAKKFLPPTIANSSFLVDQEAADTYGGERPPLFQRTRAGNKNDRQADSSLPEAEADAGRRSKLMVSDPEETDTVADGVFLKGYDVALQKMHGLGIDNNHPSTSTSATTQGKQRSSNSSDVESLDLRTVLIHCADAVSTGDRGRATDLLWQIKRRASPTGDASQRLAHCFVQGLEARLAGGGGQPRGHTDISAGAAAGSLVKAYTLYLSVCPFKMAAFKFSNMAISKALAVAGTRKKKKKVHIVDYGVHHGLQWPLQLDAWAKQEGGPPEVRITGVDFPQPGFRPAARIDDTGRRLADFARQRGVPFRFRSVVAANWETVSAEDLDLRPDDEVLVVNALFYFSRLMDEGGGGDIDAPSPRDVVLGNIGEMRPDVFVLCVDNSSHNAPFFVTRFREALSYYSAMFDMLDATAARDDADRVLVEQELFGRRAFNAIACEGPDRVQRPEAYRQWQARICKAAAGLRQLPLDPHEVEYLSKRVKDGYHKDFVVDVDQQWVLQGWKGRILCAMSAWTWAAAAHDDHHHHDAENSRSIGY
ncbi:hypothetical protein U9M48_037481 [Paspalum notatum var. saurae]|uniref:Scarecrow-like protein 9 n=1 Tax=Paspalum notatum var. saurae TaxID=547442 RepID=A0AAQ3UG26_PASNO